ncbi:MAG: type II secretion system protein [Verrucomicrobia bacterium]|nr:type II secretion system protein [Verrucomicrobiota bacterium]
MFLWITTRNRRRPPILSGRAAFHHAPCRIEGIGDAVERAASAEPRLHRAVGLSGLSGRPAGWQGHGAPPLRARAGFSLIELLVVIVIIGILAALLLPTLSRAQAKAQGIQCMNHHRQLMLAWRMYAEDNHDRLLYASGDDNPANNPYVWITGYLDYDPANRSNWDIAQDIKKSPLWPYCGAAAGIWKCPADKSTVTVNGQVLPRVRSMSMNLWVGGFAGKVDLDGPGWRVYLNMHDLVDPGPAQTFVLLDEREDMINLGNLFVDMRGFPNTPALLQFYVDYPASYHNRAGGLSFADGHSEIKPWLDPRTCPPVKKGVAEWLPDQPTPSPNNPDITWLQQRCTRRINAER